MKKIHLHVIQSLAKDEKQTGELLLNQLDNELKLSADIKFESTISYASSPQEFIKELDTFQFTYDAVKIIQLDVHGSEDGSCLIAADGKTITPDDFLKSLGHLYSRCGGDLYVNLAACNGTKLFDDFNPTAFNKPFDGIIAPNKIIKDNEALRYSVKFCKTMIETQDFNQAKLNAKIELEANSMENILSGKAFEDFYKV